MPVFENVKNKLPSAVRFGLFFISKCVYLEVVDNSGKSNVEFYSRLFESHFVQ